MHPRVLHARASGPRTVRALRGRTTAGLLSALLVLLATGPGRAEAPGVAPETDAAPANTAPAPVVHPVLVAQSHIDPTLAPVALGYAEFVRQQLARVGVAVVPGDVTRRAMKQAGTAKSTGLSEAPDGGDAEIARARRTGAGIALLVDLRARRGVVEIDMRAHSLDGSSSRLVGGALGVGTLTTLAATTNPALLQVLPALTPGEPMQPPSEGTPDVEQLAAASRALVALDAHSLAVAWRELDGLESPFVSAIRDQIQAASTHPGLSIAEHARLVVAQGRAAQGWKLIFDRAEKALAARDDAPLLLAAGEVQLARGNARGAVPYLEQGVALAPDDAETNLGLARAYEAANRIDDAKESYQRAAQLAPAETLPLERLAALPGSSREERAGYLLEAAKRSSEQLRAKTAQVDLAQAMRLDPDLKPVASEAAGALQARIGQPAESLASYQEAIAASEPTPARLRGVARAQEALQDTGAATATYLEVLKLDGDDVDALHDLGEIYVETGEADKAVVHLEHARELTPARPDVQRALARAFRERGQEGDLQRAQALYESANRISQPTAEELQDLARVQNQLGDVDAAILTLEHALVRRRLSMYGRQALADAYLARGDRERAEEVMEVVRLVSGGSAGTAAAEQDAATSESFDALLQSFVTPQGYGDRVAFLGLRSGDHWRDRLVEWLHPKAPNLAAIETGLLAAIDRSHSLVAAPASTPEMLGASLDDLRRFDADVSRSAELIGFVNLSLDTDAVFLGRVLHPLGSVGAVAACGSRPYYVLELRKLGGRSEGEVSLLANRACVEAGPDSAYVAWNRKALVGWGLLALLLLRPAIRGWGRVVVRVRAPQHGRALFSISISRRPRKFKEDKKQSAAPSWRFEKRLQAVRGNERRLKGTFMVFGMVPARRKPYYVTVRGPLLDLGTDKLIGEFLEEKTVSVRRWRTVEVKFDMRTQTAAITVIPQLAGGSIDQARVALRGDPQSLRFVSGGQAYVYATPGSHVVVVGAADRVVEVPLEIDSSKPVTLPVAMDDLQGIVFSGCPGAVAPYVEGDYTAAATALQEAGDPVAADRVRALHLRRKGDTEGAARVLENAGMHAESVKVRSGDASGAATGPSGELLEKAGEHARAGEAYEAEGDLAAAGRNYEAAYDYQRAADCYSEVGDVEKALAMLEALGDVYEAGKYAAEHGQIDRAIHSLQQVDGRHGFYSEGCRLLAELLARRGEIDLAVEKYAEALEIWGPDNAPLDMQRAYAELLEQASRPQDALTTYERIRRRDVHFGDVSARIEDLKKHLSQQVETSPRDSSTVLANSATSARIGDENSRYELLEELGRGGMGVVFRARDRNLGRVVALKVLPENLRQHPQAVKLFLREARAAAALNHQNIVTLFDAGREGDTYFLTMECLEGSGLESVLASRGPLPTRAAATVGLQVAAGLDYAQRSKIVHRDIKPSNLFLTRDRTVKIMDFGLAKMVEEVRRGSTLIGGTPNFMAPEQAAGGDVDHRTDLYALGGTLFELVTGTVPFESGDVVYHHVHTPPPDARERNVDVPAAMAELIMHLMAKKPEDRIQSARELATQLQAILRA